MGIGFLNPPKYVKICFSFFLFINTILKIEIKFAFHRFPLKVFNKHILVCPTFYLKKTQVQSFIEWILGKRETGNYIQQDLALPWLVTQTVIHDANVADKKRLSSLLKYTGLFCCFKLFQRIFAPGNLSFLCPLSLELSLQDLSGKTKMEIK